MERKRKIYSKNNQKMLPVLDYSFEMPILNLKLNLLFAGWKPVFDCVWICKGNAIFKILLSEIETFWNFSE